MNFDDLRKLVASNALFSLDRIVGTRLVTLFYVLGLGAIGLWAITHFFGSFALGFAEGLWGLLEIAVFGGLMLVALRLISELVLVYLAANAEAVVKADVSRAPVSLMSELKDALDSLSDEDGYEIGSTTDPIPPTDPKR